MNKYLSNHRPENQKTIIAGISIDPELPDDFDMTDNALRHPVEIDDWWGNPYIVTEACDDQFESFDDHVVRSENNTLFTVNETRDEYDSKIAERKADWLKTYPSGVSYTVRCLDGGAWDRSTWKGTYSSLDAALTKAKTIQRSNEAYIENTPAETQKVSRKNSHDLEL